MKDHAGLVLSLLLIVAAISFTAGRVHHKHQDGSPSIYVRLAAEQCATTVRMTVQGEHEASRMLLDARLADVFDELYQCTDLVGVLATGSHMFVPAHDDLEVLP